jgi:hypothetical protein
MDNYLALQAGLLPHAQSASNLPTEFDEDTENVFKLRSYQQEMVEESLRRNIIVAVSCRSMWIFNRD